METNRPTEHIYGSLHKDQVIPAFTLPGADGMPHGPWDYKQRDNLVLLFTYSSEESETRGLLRTFAQHYAEFREEQCAVLAVSADTVIVNLHTQQVLNLPFPLLADPKGEVISRYTTWDSATHMLTPSMVLTDRYGALYQQWQAKQEVALPPITELLASLQYLNSICTP
jgi:peroxiredoxin